MSYLYCYVIYHAEQTNQCTKISENLLCISLCLISILITIKSWIIQISYLKFQSQSNFCLIFMLLWHYTANVWICFIHQHARRFSCYFIPSTEDEKKNKIIWKSTTEPPFHHTGYDCFNDSFRLLLFCCFVNVNISKLWERKPK